MIPLALFTPCTGQCSWRKHKVMSQLMPAMLYVLLGTTRKHSPASGEDVSKKLTSSDDSTHILVHLKNKHTDT